MTNGVETRARRQGGKYCWWGMCNESVVSEGRGKGVRVGFQCEWLNGEFVDNQDGERGCLFTDPREIPVNL